MGARPYIGTWARDIYVACARDMRRDGDLDDLLRFVPLCLLGLQVVVVRETGRITRRHLAPVQTSLSWPSMWSRHVAKACGQGMWPRHVAKEVVQHAVVHTLHM